jgi:hypothetical protein
MNRACLAAQAPSPAGSRGVSPRVSLGSESLKKVTNPIDILLAVS